MNKKTIKEYWFACLCGALVLFALVFYIFGVAGYSSDLEKHNEDLKRTTRSLSELGRKRPTPEWNDALGKSRRELEVQAGAINKALEEADRLVEEYFALEDDGRTRTSTPPGQAYMAKYKSIVVAHWNALEEAYSQVEEKAGAGPGQMPMEGMPGMPGGMPGFPGAPGVAPAPKATQAPKKDEAEARPKGPFICPRAVLAALEPKWLREPVALTLDQAREAQKRYWIIEHLLGIFKEVPILALKAMIIQDEQLEPGAELNGQPFWSSRGVGCSLEISHHNAIELMRRIHQSPLLLRVVGFRQRNLNTAPPGVQSDAVFVSFSEDPGVELQLILKHYDLLGSAEAESIKKGAEQNPPQPGMMPGMPPGMEGSPRPRGGRR